MINHMDRHAENRGNVVEFCENWNEYRIRVITGDDAIVHQVINFCPWCGEHLPKSLKKKWFKRLTDMGIDPMIDKIPTQFQNSSWWN